ncbi:MAG: hypothetical protein LQ351_004014 [Letrouitia transgressa]|nr:MAG: hypothetical protein LQ351_004014 [Letrouitia transgressa]
MKPLDEFLPNGALLLHEYTHAWFATADVKMREGAKKGEVAYNHEYALRLLREANGPTKTRNNAHTYAIFAAAVTFDKSNWSLNPDHMSADRDLK